MDDQVLEVLCDFCGFYPVLVDPDEDGGTCPECDALVVVEDRS